MVKKKSKTSRAARGQAPVPPNPQDELDRARALDESGTSGLPTKIEDEEKVSPPKVKPR